MEKKESDLMLEQFRVAQKYLSEKNYKNLAADLNFFINKIKELLAEEAKVFEKSVTLKFIGDTYYGRGLSVRNGNIVEVKESDAKYLLDSFPKDWEKVKRLNKEGSKS